MWSWQCVDSPLQHHEIFRPRDIANHSDWLLTDMARGAKLLPGHVSGNRRFKMGVKLLGGCGSCSQLPSCLMLAWGLLGLAVIRCVMRKHGCTQELREADINWHDSISISPSLDDCRRHNRSTRETRELQPFMLQSRSFNTESMCWPFNNSCCLYLGLPVIRAYRNNLLSAVGLDLKRTFTLPGINIRCIVPVYL